MIINLELIDPRLTDNSPVKESKPGESSPSTTAIHTPLPRSSQETTRPIMSVHKETGILQVNMMWSCTKCSFAYNAMDNDVCEICNLPRSPVNNNNQKKKKVSSSPWCREFS